MRESPLDFDGVHGPVSDGGEGFLVYFDSS